MKHQKLNKFRVNRRGSMLIYSLYLTMMMFTLVSVAVDYGRMQMVKTQLQRSADATARGALQMYESYGSSTAMAYAPYLPSYDPVDYNSSTRVQNSTPYTIVTWGYWTNNTFYAGTNSSYPTAVQVKMYRTKQYGNPVPLLFPMPSGKTVLSQTCDVKVTATAIIPAPVALSQVVSANWDPWLANATSGTTASYDDTAPAQQETTPLTVIPGSKITITSVTGDVMHTPAAATDGPDGETTNMYWHMKDPPSGAVAEGQGAQNNIGDVVAPIDSLLGLFMNGSAPTAANAPTTVRQYSTDYNQSTPINNITLQQPFYVGDGTNYTGSHQTFVVPPRATQMFLGIMDGYEWNNNNGTFTVTGTEQPPIQMVQ